MLTDLEVSHFKVFGYVVVRGCVDHEHVKRLQTAFDREIDNNPRVKGEYGRKPRPGGTRSLCPFAETDEAFTELIEHPKLMEAMRDIDGIEFLYFSEDMNSFVGDTNWHCDFFPPHHESRPAKAIYYLDEMLPGDGALDLIPGTNNPEYAGYIFRTFGSYGDETGGPRLNMDHLDVPSVAIETTPGDVVLWENRMWHHATRRLDGKPRRMLSYSYFRDPMGNIVEEKYVRNHLNSRGSKSGLESIYSKTMMQNGGVARENMASRLEALGVNNVRG